MPNPNLGTILWTDLTIPNAEEVRDFYKAVVGWDSSPVDMGGYNDFNMLPRGGDKPSAGVCHARGVNKDLPPQWLIYVVVESVDDSAAACERLGGRVLVGPKEIGADRLCIIQDPAGAVMALYEQGAPST
jgi:predicted enzyme related to lactoylglutathione lyase